MTRKRVDLSIRRLHHAKSWNLVESSGWHYRRTPYDEAVGNYDRLVFSMGYPLRWEKISSQLTRQAEALDFHLVKMFQPTGPWSISPRFHEEESRMPFEGKRIEHPDFGALDDEVVVEIATIHESFLDGALVLAREYGYFIDSSLLGIPRVGGRDGLDGLDMSGRDLRNIDLSGMDLSGVDFCGSNLRGADLSRSNLQKAKLDDADLAGANLTRAEYGALGSARVKMNRLGPGRLVQEAFAQVDSRMKMQEGPLLIHEAIEQLMSEYDSQASPFPLGGTWLLHKCLDQPVLSAMNERSRLLELWCEKILDVVVEVGLTNRYFFVVEDEIREIVDDAIRVKPDSIVSQKEFRHSRARSDWRHAHVAMSHPFGLTVDEFLEAVYG